MQTIIFDMDGVIVDSEPLHIDHLHAYLKKKGVNNPEQFDKSLKGVNARDTWAMLTKKFDIKEDIGFLIEDSRKSYVDYLNSLDKLPEIPGAVKLIKTLHAKKYPLALGSSAAPLRIDLFLEKLGVKELFKVIVSGDSVKRSKPFPDIFLKAAKLMHANPSNCVVIEDANNGVVAAHAAGMKCIAYSGSDHNDDDLSQADLIVDSFEQLSQTVKQTGLPL